MKKKRFSEEQIIAVLKEAEAGAKTKELCRPHGISEPTSEVRRDDGLGSTRSLFRYRSRRPECAKLRERITQIAAIKRRYGYDVCMLFCVGRAGW
jgi:putative transposase